MTSKISNCGFDPSGGRAFQPIKPKKELKKGGEYDISGLTHRIVTQHFKYTGKERYTLTLQNHGMVLELLGSQRVFGKIQRQNRQWVLIKDDTTTKLSATRQISDDYNNTLARIQGAYHSTPKPPSSSSTMMGYLSDEGLTDQSKREIDSRETHRASPELVEVMKEQSHSIQQTLSQLTHLLGTALAKPPEKDFQTDRLHQNLEALTTSVKAMADILTPALKAHETKLQEIDHRVQQLSTSLDRLSGPSSHIQSQLQASQREVETLRSEFTRFTSDLGLAPTSLNGRVTSLENNLQALQEKERQLQQQVQELQGQLKEQNQQELSQQIAALNKNHSNELETLKQQYGTELLKIGKEASETAEKLRMQLAQSKQEQERLSAQLKTQNSTDTLSEELKQKQAEASQRIDDLNKKLEEANLAHQEALNQKEKELRSQMDELQKQHETDQQLLKNLQARSDSAQQEAEKLRAELEGQRKKEDQRFLKAETEITQRLMQNQKRFREEAEQAKLEAAALKKEKAELEKKLEPLEVEFHTLTQDSERQNQEIATLKKEVLSLNKKNLQDQQQNTSLKEELEKSKQETEQYKGINRGLKAKASLYDESREQIEELENQTKALEQEKDALNAELQKTQKLYSDAKAAEEAAMNALVETELLIAENDLKIEQLEAEAQKATQVVQNYSRERESLCSIIDEKNDSLNLQIELAEKLEEQNQTLLEQIESLKKTLEEKINTISEESLDDFMNELARMGENLPDDPESEEQLKKALNEKEALIAQLKEEIEKLQKSAATVVYTKDGPITLEQAASIVYETRDQLKSFHTLLKQNLSLTHDKQSPEFQVFIKKQNDLLEALKNFHQTVSKKAAERTTN